MTPEQFAYWLQGCAELNPEMDAPTPEQWKSIKEHLQTVFVKVTPPISVKEEEPERFEIKLGTKQNISDLVRAWNQRNIHPFEFGKQPVITC